MSDPCPAVADRLSESLGGFDCDSSPVIALRNPTDLSNWTLPVLEGLMVIGAVLAVLYAVRRLRRDGDPTYLALGLSGIVYLLVTEIPLYFPEKFGAGEYLGTSFVHNVFTVEFLYDRLPLYIVSLYLALPMLAYEIVRSLRVFETRGPLLGALCVGAVHSTFYEVFDHLGPQLRWWAWNLENNNNRPFFDAVPMNSVTLFSLVGPAILVYLLRRWVAEPHARGPVTAAAVVGRSFAVGAPVTLLVAVVSLPSSLFGGDDPNTTAQAVVLGGIFAIGWLIAIVVLARAWRQEHATASASPYVRFFGPLYLAVIGILWITALPDYVDAVGGISPDGTPVGNLAFAALCFTAGLVAVVATTWGLRRTSPSEQPETALQPAG